MSYYGCKYIGIVFAMTNEEVNKVVAMKRDISGKLVSTRTYKTGGKGSNEEIIDPLQSQGSIILSECRKFLFVVNAGDSTISSFRICDDELILRDVVSSEGFFPNSLTTIGDLLYVTNVGVNEDPSTVVGFRITECGCLEMIEGSRTLLSQIDTQPGNIIASPTGDTLSVTEKATNNISVFEIKYNGKLIGPTVNPSNGNVPFSSVYIGDEILINTEAQTNALTSYNVVNGAELSVISPSVENGQQAVCWVVANPNNRYAYTSNTGSGTISIYSISPTGELTYIKSVPSAISPEEAPIDAGIDRCGCYFYVLNAREGAVGVFKVEEEGRRLRLIQVYEDTRLPKISSQGIAVL